MKKCLKNQQDKNQRSNTNQRGQREEEYGVSRVAKEPSEQEGIEHNARGHFLFPAWGPHCVKGAGESAKRRKIVAAKRSGGPKVAAVAATDDAMSMCIVCGLIESHLRGGHAFTVHMPCDDVEMGLCHCSLAR